ncbi:MAG: FeS cluster assembly protein SufD [Verrucomicrobia bacterium ADurb.Bin345]|nr:MAG: FeS cluster assembly protein SufD [Verrucomicrobia bacterium ADurb.Bin345]
MAVGLEQEVKNEAFVAGFDEAASRALAGESAVPALRELREVRFAEYRAVPLPTRRMEEWRRTDPARFPFERMKRLPTIPRGACAPHAWDDLFDVIVSVEDGAFDIRDRSGVLEGGQVLVAPLEQALREHADRVKPFLEKRARAEAPDKFEALGDAFWNAGFFIHVAPGVELERGVLLRYRQSGAGGILIPRVIVAVGERSRAVLVESMESPDGVELMSVVSREFHVAEGAKLQSTTLRAWGDRTVHLAGDWARLSRDARLEWITLNFGGRLTKVRFGSDGAEPGANAELDGLYFASGEQHVDQKTLQVHSSPDTYSRLLYKGVAKDKAHSVYQGQIVARPGAIRVDAYQRNNNLVLNDGARADSMPGLQIDADDLKCSHGSTVGNLDEDELFYLRCRGIDEASARKALIRGFFEDVAGRIPHECVREVVHSQVDAKIG